LQPEFFINEGVRRAVAAREAGLIDIPARIVELGKPDVLTRLQLDQLFSPKPSVIRDFRYIRYTEYPTQVLKTEPPPIDVEPLGLAGQKNAIPLAQVILR
jgi:hypothetical protein